MIPCPECHGQGVVLSTKTCINGTRRRRLVCKACDHRWTDYQGEPPGHRGGVPRGTKLPHRPLTADEVRAILLAHGSTRKISQQVGRSPGTVLAIRSGETHADLFPELERKTHRTCLQCSHWSNGCGFGYPDPQIEGISFAQDCATFTTETP